MSRNALSNANAHRPTDRNATTYGVVNGSGEKVERETEKPRAAHMHVDLYLISEIYLRFSRSLSRRRHDREMLRSFFLFSSPQSDRRKVCQTHTAALVNPKKI